MLNSFVSINVMYHSIMEQSDEDDKETVGALHPQQSQPIHHRPNQITARLS